MTADGHSAFPSVETSPAGIAVNLRKPLSADVHQLRVRAVIDEDERGELQGIEILHLMDQLGRGAFNAWRDAARSFSYDRGADAFYLRLRSGHSSCQRSIDAVVHLDRAGLFRITLGR